MWQYYLSGLLVWKLELKWKRSTLRFWWHRPHCKWIVDRRNRSNDKPRWTAAGNCLHCRVCVYGRILSWCAVHPSCNLYTCRSFTRSESKRRHWIRYKRRIFRSSVVRDNVRSVSNDRQKYEKLFLIIKANKMHYFSILFWERSLHVSDRLTVRHQGS